MSDRAYRPVFISMRIEDRPQGALTTEGSEPRDCHYCKRPCMFSPSILKHRLAATGIFVCLQCGLEKHGNAEVASPTEEQVQEFRSARRKRSN